MSNNLPTSLGSIQPSWTVWLRLRDALDNLINFEKIEKNYLSLRVVRRALGW